MAQEGKQTPAGVEGDVSGWVKLCAKDEHFGNAGVCLVKYEELESANWLGSSDGCGADRRA